MLEPTLLASVACPAHPGQGQLERAGDGKAPCVVALHGFGGTATDFGPLPDRLAEAGLALRAPLLPGHGTRVELLQDVTFDDWVCAARDHAAAAARAYGRVLLLGFSAGSLVAMQIASERPAWLCGLAALGNALRLRLHSALPLRLWELCGRPMPDAYLMKSFPADLVDKTLVANIVCYDRHPLRAALEVYRAGAKTRGVVSRIECPTLILHGRRDRVCSWRNAQWLSEHIGARDVKTRIFERSGHVLACDQEREEVAREVVAFASRV